MIKNRIFIFVLVYISFIYKICGTFDCSCHDSFKTGAIKERKLSRKGILHLNTERFRGLYVQVNISTEEKDRVYGV